MTQGDSRAEGWDYIFDLHRREIRYDNGYWVTIRVVKVAPSENRPHGLKYAFTLHDEKDDRILGYDNAHGIDVTTGPARKSKQPKEFDHIDWRGKKSVPYAFTTPYHPVSARGGLLCARGKDSTGGGGVMTKRILHIGIASREYIHNRMLEIAKRGRRSPNEPHVWFTSFEALAGVFSKQNMLLIEIMRDAELQSVTELAERVGREKTNVLRSLKTLEEFDIVRFEEGKGGRKGPRLKYDDFQSRVYSSGKVA